MKKFSELSAIEREELIADAQAIMNSKAMKYVFEEAKEEYLDELIQAEVGGLTASTAHASMKVLAEVQQRLQSIINSGLMVRNKGRYRT